MHRFRVWYYEINKDGKIGHYIKDVDAYDAQSAKSTAFLKLTENKTPGQLYPMISIDKARKIE